jgi:PAS domain S-box-containing protein
MFVYAAAPSLDNSYREAVEGMLVSSMTGPCCQAVATRQTYVVPDVAADPKIVKFQEFAEPLGIRSAWCTPIFSNEGKVLGTFAHYYFEARDPSPRDKRMVELLTRAAAVAIERNRAEAALRKLNETLEQRVQAETRERLQIWNVSQDLLVIAGLDGKYLSVNPAWTATLGWSEADLLGKSSQWLLHPEDQERTGAELDHLAKRHKTLRFENRLRAKDGSYHWISWKGAPDNGRIYSMGRDITEHKRAEDALRELESDFAHMNRVSMMGELAASLSHEIVQPIASARNNVRAALNFLEMQPADLGEIREALACVVGDVDRAGDIVDRIRDHIKKEPLRKDHFDLNAAINEVIVLARSAIIRNGISVETRLADGLCPVHGDRVQLQQVILNLILNAVEAMGSVEPGPRNLLVSTEPNRRGVLVAVHDSGPGIDPELLERIFEAFYTTKSSGVGMGLSICRSIIDAHGGRLWAEANEPRGAIFQFTLPSAEKELMNFPQSAHETGERMEALY